MQESISKIIKQYKKEDDCFFINEDRDLIPIKIKLPECTDITKIDGYGLPVKEQKFTLQKYPQKLKKLEKESGHNIETIWSRLNQNQIFYSDEIKWIKKQWYYRLFGYWCFINGKPTYLDPWNFFYLNYWHLDVGLPQYRDRDRRWFLAQRFAYNDTMDFVNKDEKGNAIPEEDGTYKMYDTGRRLCYGTTGEKFRRAGDTSKSLSLGYEIVSRSPVGNMGIQAEVSSSARKDFGFVTHAWRKVPFFFQPAFDNPTNPQEKINFTTPSQRGMTANVVGLDAGLESTITWATTANRGFYDGWKLIFCLLDEEGKMTEESAVKRWGVVKKCLGQGNQRVGFSIHPSTVGDMKDEGGEEFYELAHKQSNYYNRNENGETTSGLYNYYFRSTDGAEGFIDEYGMSMEEEARTYLQNTLDKLLKENTEKSLRKYREEKRMMPMNYADCWQTDSGDIGMPTEKIEARISGLLMGNNLTKRVMYKEYDPSNPDGIVEQIDDPNGRWEVSYDLPPEKRNKKYLEKDIWFPYMPSFVSCADPFRTEKSRLEGSRASKGAGCVFWDRDYEIDPEDKDVSLWISNRNVCTYLYRSDTLTTDEFCEDMLLMCRYWGALMYPEHNIDLVEPYFMKRGYGGYLLYGFDHAAGRLKKKSGFSALGASQQTLINCMIDYMKRHAHRECHMEILKQAKECKGVEDLTKLDLLVAAGGCQLAIQNRFYITRKKKNTVKKEEGLFDEYTY